MERAFATFGNRVHHDWADALVFRDDVMLPSGPTGFTLPLVIDWCWPQLEDLPEAEKFPRGRDEYGQAFAGRSIRATIDEFGEFLYTTVFPAQSSVV